MDLLIGIQLGTTEVKCGIFSCTGRLITSAQGGYPLLADECYGAATSRPKDWWRAVRKVLRICTSGVSGGNIRGLSVGSHGPSLVALDRKGNPLRDSLLWMDRRAVKEAEILSERLGYYEDPAWYMPKALWIKKQEPELFMTIRWFMQPLDFINFKLTGKITATLGSEHLKPWKEQAIVAAGISPHLFPPFVVMSTLLGHVSDRAAIETGVPAGTPVLAGTGGADFVEELIGTATLQPGRICDRGGTSQGINLCWTKEIRDHGFFCIPHPIAPSCFHVGGLLSTTGKALHWYKNLFYGRGVSYEKLLQEASLSPPGSRGLFFLPHLAGNRTPWWDPHARGVLLGLCLGQEKGDFVRSILEGVAFETGQIIRLFKAGGAEAYEIRASGGQAKSPLWNQIKADVTGLPVKVPRIVDAGTLGLAIIAGRGAGVLGNIQEAAEKLVTFSTVFEPEGERHMLYRERLALYETLYPALKETFGRLSSLDKGDGYDHGKRFKT